VKLTISKRRKKTEPKTEPIVSITIPDHIELRGGETGKLLSDADNIVVKFSDGGTIGYPPELFVLQKGE
jgi:hypothetical protein